MATRSLFVPRVLDLRGLLAKKSHFLPGPRQTHPGPARRDRGECTPHISARDLKPLRSLAEEAMPKRLRCVSLEPRPRIVDSIEILSSDTFLKARWAGEYA